MLELWMPKEAKLPVLLVDRVVYLNGKVSCFCWEWEALLATGYVKLQCMSEGALRENWQQVRGDAGQRRDNPAD